MSAAERATRAKGFLLTAAGRVMDRIRPRYWTCRECRCTNALWEWGCYRCGDGAPTSWLLGFPRWED